MAHNLDSSAGLAKKNSKRHLPDFACPEQVLV